MTKSYIVELDGKTIGRTLLEKADAPMGVIFGVLIVDGDTVNYASIKKYCKDNEIELSFDSFQDKVISTRAIPGLIVKTTSGKEIKGIATYIEGMDSDCFEVTVVGYSYPDYEIEFPHHVKEYEEQFK